MKRGILVSSLLFAVLSLSLVMASDCYLLSNNVPYQAGSADDQCVNTVCSDTNPLTSAMYDSGSCILIKYTNCACENDVVKPECSYSIINTTYYSGAVYGEPTQQDIRGPSCYPFCGSECGRIPSPTATECVPDFFAGDADCWTCACDPTKDPQCTKTLDPTANPGQCRKCNETGFIVDNVGAECAYNATDTGVCGSTGVCLFSDKTCADLGGDQCSQGKFCAGETVTAKDGLCCKSLCVEVAPKCEQAGGKNCSSTQICDGVQILAQDSNLCCKGVCIENQGCFQKGGQICLTEKKQVCEGDTIQAKDGACCINKTAEGKECVTPESYLNCTEIKTAEGAFAVKCEEKQKCSSGELFKAFDTETCCKGTCESGLDWGEIIKWLIIAIVVIGAISLISCKGGGILKKLGGGLGGL